jgi:hypothetical protein
VLAVSRESSLNISLLPSILDLDGHIQNLLLLLRLEAFHCAGSRLDVRGVDALLDLLVCGVSVILISRDSYDSL